MSPLRFLGRILALFLILLFVLLTPALLLAYHFQHALLEGDLAERLATDSDLPEMLLHRGALLLAEAIPQSAGGLPVARLSASDWEQVLRVAMPPEELQRWIRNGVGALQKWLREGGNFLDEIVLPIGRMRENVLSDPRQTLLRVLTEAQPACRGQEPLPYPDLLIPGCRPEGDLTAFYRELGKRWQQEPQEVWRQLWRIPLPEQLSLGDIVDLEVQARIRQVDRSRPLYWVRLAGRFLLPLLIGQGVVLLLLIVLLAARNGAEVLRWAGGPVALAGLLTLLLGLAVLLGTPALADLPREEIPQDLYPALQETLRLLVAGVWPPLISQGGILLAVGLLAWGASFFVLRRPTCTAVR